MSVRRTLVWQGLLVLTTAAFCAALGTWQLRRLQWKQALLTKIETRASAPSAAPPALGSWSALDVEESEWTHVAARGRFDFAHVALVFTGPPPEAGPEPGFLALMPLRLKSGGVVIVNRGFVPQSKASAAAFRSEPSSDVVVQGWLRASQRRNFFTPNDDPSQGKWFTADPLKIAAAFDLADAAPFYIEQQAKDSGDDGLARPDAADLTLIPNNHLGYAVTWFGLGFAALILFVVYARRRLT